MPSVFISYRRKDSSTLATLVTKELERQNIDVFLDTLNIDGGGSFPKRLYNAIESADILVCLLGSETLESQWVKKELQHAHKLGKILIPVFQESYITKTTSETYIQALLESDGVHILDLRNLYIDEAISHLAQLIKDTPTTTTTYPVLYPLLSIVLLAIGSLFIGFVLQAFTGRDPIAISPTNSENPISTLTEAVATIATGTEIFVATENNTPVINTPNTETTQANFNAEDINCPPAEDYVIIVDEIIIIEPNSSNFSFGTYSDIEVNSFEGTWNWLVYYTRTEPTDSTSWAAWRAPIETGGCYEISVFIPNQHSTTTRARYRISGIAGTTLEVVIAINQATHQNSWVPLCICLLDETLPNVGRVGLNNATGEFDKEIAYDAVRFRFVTEATEDS